MPPQAPPCAVRRRNSTPDAAMMMRFALAAMVVLGLLFWWINGGMSPPPPALRQGTSTIRWRVSPASPSSLAFHRRHLLLNNTSHRNATTFPKLRTVDRSDYPSPNEWSLVLEVGSNAHPDFCSLTKVLPSALLVTVEPVVATRCERMAFQSSGENFVGVVPAAIGPATFAELLASPSSSSASSNDTIRSLLVVPKYHAGPPHEDDHLSSAVEGSSLAFLPAGRFNRLLNLPNPPRTVPFTVAKHSVCSSLLELSGENRCTTKRKSIRVPLLTTDELIFATDRHVQLVNQSTKDRKVEDRQTTASPPQQGAERNASSPAIVAPLPIRILSFDLQGFDLNGGVASLTSRAYINDRVANVFVECVDLPVENVSTPASPLSHSCGQAVACIEEHWGFKGIYCSGNVAPDEYNCLLHNPRHRMRSGTVSSELGATWKATATTMTSVLNHPHVNRDVLTVRTPRFPAPCPWSKR